MAVRFPFPGNLLRLLLLLPLLLSTDGGATGRSAVETRYEIVAKGIRVGKVTATQQLDTAQLLRFENHTDVNASFLWLGYRQSIVEQADILGQNLTRYSRRGSDNGVSVQVEGRLAGNAFRFDELRDGARRSLAIPRDSYDHTTMECPEATMVFGPDGTRTLRMLDTEHLAVVKRTYRLIREDVYRLGGRDYRCRVVDFSDPNKNCRRWIGRDGNAVIIFRQDGRGKVGSYSLRAREVSGAL